MALTENLTEGGNYTHLAANASTDNIVAGAGVLINVVINTKGATANTLTLYDDLLHGTSGHIIAVIDTTANTGVLNYDVRLVRGLSATMATGTAADVTISAVAGAQYDQ